MKIQVTGEGASAKVLRHHLTSLGYRVADDNDKNADYVVHMEPSEQAGIALSGMPGELADNARRLVAELAPGSVAWQETGSARGLHVAAGAGQADAAERGVLRALLQITGHGVKKSWFRKYFSRRTK
jgi:hypothetical protein